MVFLFWKGKGSIGLACEVSLNQDVFLMGFFFCLHQIDSYVLMNSHNPKQESDNSSSNRSVQPPSEKHSSTDFVRSANTSKLIPPSMRSSFEDDTRPPLSDICSTAVPEEDGEVRPQAHRNRGHEPALADSLESMIGSRPPSPDPLEVLAPMSRIVTVDLDALPKELGDIVERYREMGKVVPIEKKKKGKGKEGKSEEREDDGVERTDDETSTEEEDEGEKEEGPGVEEGAEGEKSGKGNLGRLNDGDFG